MDLHDNIINMHPIPMVLCVRNTSPVNGIPCVLVMGAILGSEFSTYTDNERVVKGKMVFVPDSIEVTNAYPGWRMQDIISQPSWPIVEAENLVDKWET